MLNEDQRTDLRKARASLKNLSCARRLTKVGNGTNYYY